MDKAHDNDHSYGWQSFEYNIAFNKIDKNGLLVSDDVDYSCAFIDFYKRLNGYEMLNFVNNNKVLGIIKKRSKDHLKLI